ncbi:MAG: hypothetical protein ACM3Q2_02755, partial [Syntrophothermus sp.]
MRLTEFEKEVINKLCDNEVNSVKSFFEVFISAENYKSIINFAGPVYIPSGETVKLVTEQLDVISKTIAFLIIVKRLTDAGLLYIIKDTTLEIPKVLIKDGNNFDTTFQKFYSLIKDYENNLFTPT